MGIDALLTPKWGAILKVNPEVIQMYEGIFEREVCSI